MTWPLVVLFDLDDTLFAHARAVDLGVTAHRASAGGALARADESAELARWHELEERHYRRYLEGELTFLGQRRERAREFVAPFGVDLSADADADRWFDEYLVEYERGWMLHSDALRCLDMLSDRGIRIGIITNGDIAFQSAKIAAIGLTDRVEHLIASGEVGVTKPDARIFEHACALFGVLPSDAVYVGDRLETDSIGAADAGLGGVWLARDGRHPGSGDHGVAGERGIRVITTLDELTSVLGL